MRPSRCAFGLIAVVLAMLGTAVDGAPRSHKAPAATQPAAPAAESVHPPIPIHFNLPEAGVVTLVIDDAKGNRVRNLIADTKFPAGDNVAWWDATDDLLRDPEAYRHGLYYIPAEFVKPGDYVVHGLSRGPIDLHFEFSVYTAGRPAWSTADSTGAWLSNHTPPCAALFVPPGRTPSGKALVYLGCYVSEGTHGLAWVDLKGHKQGGVNWVGGNWTGAQFLARDDGPSADAKTYAYAAAVWFVESEKDPAKKEEIRLTALTRDGNKDVHQSILAYHFGPPVSKTTGTLGSGHVDRGSYLGGLAVHNNMLVFSMPVHNQLVFVDTNKKAVVGTAEVKDPHGLAFDKDGQLLVLSGTSLLRYKPTSALPLPTPETVNLQTEKLDAPHQLTFDAAGNIYITDWGQCHQVKVFSPSGEFLRTIGLKGVPKAGPYDPHQMHNPDGLTIDSNKRLWVAENDFQPKRVSVWTLDGRFIHGFYGPGEYGGGGKLDPEDKTRFYYHGIEFKLDWEKGTNQPSDILYRPGPGELSEAAGYWPPAVPEQPHYFKGRRYMSNSYSSNPVTGAEDVILWLETNGIAKPVAAMGRADRWSILKTDAFKSRWPKDNNGQALFVWTDLNGDGKVQPREVQIIGAYVQVNHVAVAPDLSMIASRVDTRAMRFAPKRFTPQGAPIYDITKGEVLTARAQGPMSSGGSEALWNENGWTVLTTPPEPLSAFGVGAIYHGKPRWAYPSLWPGLHASHESPPPDRPGELIGTTRLLGDFVTPTAGDAGPLWFLNGNQGNVFVFTVDGLFVAELFHDVRRGARWSMPKPRRNMLLNEFTLSDENFWPSVTQTKEDGKIYLVDGQRSSLVRVEGLDTVHRLPEIPLKLSVDDLAKARAYFIDAEAQRQKKRTNDTLKVAIRKTPPKVDGKMDDWANADWATIDKSGVGAWFDSKSKPYDVSGAVAIAGDRLYAAYRTGDANLLRNTGESFNALFKTGGALDLMIGADPAADKNRDKPAAGDSRLLVTQVKGKTVAMLYRAVVPGTTTPVPFSSPWRTITLDRVENISDQVTLAGADGNYELSVPLATLGLKAGPGLRIKGDIGVLRGNGFETSQRVYWANKATGITADVPSEAELTPKLWGWWKFQPAE